MLNRTLHLQSGRAGQFLFAILLAVTPAAVSGQVEQSNSAHVDMAHDEHLKGGSELAFKIVLNAPLPEGARFDVRLSPVNTDEEISVSSGEPSNKERTEFVLKTRLPEKAIPGEWHIKVIWLFLSGATWTNNTLISNGDFRFNVEGPKVQIPTKATATLVGDRR